MALPLLVNSTDCGPVNPLQGLTKRFDYDRGIQQDQFVTGRAGSSREVFRTAQHVNPMLGQETARFFSGEGLHRELASPTPNAFDVSLLHRSLPATHSHSAYSTSIPFQLQAPQRSLQTKRSAWAADFLQQTRVKNTDVVISGKTTPTSQVEAANRQTMMSPGPSNLGVQWTPPINMMSRPQFIPQPLNAQSQLITSSSAAQLEEHFQFLEELNSVTRQSDTSSFIEQSKQDPAQVKRETDDLARTAGLLVDSVKDEQNPKFKNSQFMRLMRDLRDGDVVVDGNDMVERSVVTSDGATDVKGKGKERATGSVIDPSMSTQRSIGAAQAQNALRSEEVADVESPREEDPYEVYFRKENEEYIDYWNRASSQSAIQRQDGASQSFGPQNEWGALQESWDSFEATTWGIKPAAQYQFQPHNPYLIEEAIQQTRHHAMHPQRSLYESVLELEAEVQRDSTNARAWYDLGVKQQENEREPKAIAALNRALELDPSHLPSWLALAISYTNEGDRSAADGAIQQWVSRNQSYEPVVIDFFRRVEQLNGGTLDSLTQARKHDELIHCLMAMARHGNEKGEIDADVQIALAVLLNTSEDYLKAQDCFKAALSVRPDDWQLYNRVGATLANSGLSEEAFQYYYRALELNPAYIRARFNLGISCMNMRRYEEAAQYVLDALIMQDSDGSVHAQDDKRGITSSTLWGSLRTSCIHLQRLDLAELCDRRDLEGFRREFHV
ncbi:hypothetical protein ACEPAI_7955 [Sanghuangporus weigelae]